MAPIPNLVAAPPEAVKAAALALARHMPDSGLTLGPKERVIPIRYFLGAAFGWGGLPEDRAYYLKVEPGLPAEGTHEIDVPAKVPVDEYCTISLGTADEFPEKNAMDAYNVKVMDARNDDGSINVRFGGCDAGRENCLPIMGGWNQTVRLCRPMPEILDGYCKFPAVGPAD